MSTSNEISSSTQPNKEQLSNVEKNQKRAIATLIEMTMLIQKRGGLTIHQAREAYEAINIFTVEHSPPKTTEEQVNSIKILIELTNLGQTKGVIELNEAKIMANIIDLFSKNENMTVSYNDDYFTL